ncbi:MAG: flagellar motor switch protein FliM [candidate division Zixibacteria bacterium]|nr:flagellar motor switch protein FliM [candidate division Zixibacteria bacterium]
MAKILSQEEIDALLTTVSSSEPEQDPSRSRAEQAHSVVNYDFKHPNRVSKDQVRTLENMHDNFAGHISSTLSAMLRTMVDVDLISVDQINYSEYVMSLMSPSCTYTFAAPPLDGLCIMDFNPALAFAFIDRMFGGGEKILEIERELTGIEKTVMTKIVQSVYGDLENSWQNIIPIHIGQKSFETNPQFVQVVPANETVIVISTQLKIFSTTGLVTICYPYVSLEPVLGKLSAQNWIDATKRKNLQGNRDINRENLNNISVELSVIMAQTHLTMQDFINLKMHDVIVTDQKINGTVDLLVAKKRKYMCRPGLFGKRRACQIMNLYPHIIKE